MKLSSIPKSFFTQMILYIFFPTIIFAQWAPKVNISPNAMQAGLNESMGSCIGASGDTIHVVWTDKFTPTRAAIYYRRSHDTGLTWDNVMNLTDTNGNAWNPAIAVNGQNIHVVWREIDTVPPMHRSSWYKHSVDGGNTWTLKIMLDSVIADWPAVTVSGSYVYAANDITVDTTGNTEVFFLRSTDNGNTWSQHTRLTYAPNRSEDEAIYAQGSHVFMSWNDKRTGLFKIYVKHSSDYGVNWDPDTAVMQTQYYGTMVNINGANIDVVAAGTPAGHYQIHLVQSPDTGATWGTNMDLTNDTAVTYYYPHMTRDGADLHITYEKAGAGAQYLHSGDGGATWDPPFTLGNAGITTFSAYTGCVLHVIMPDSGKISYRRNPTGNAGHCPVNISDQNENKINISVYPNPFSSQTTIEITSPEIIENTELKVYDMVGREVMKTYFGNNNSITISRNNLKGGIYIYKVFLKDREIGVGKMMVK